MAKGQAEAARTLKGFRDFLPEDKRARDEVERCLVDVFRLHGFEPVETPTIEYASLILGKYGEEADRLVYAFDDAGGRRVALPYDQTVPTARVLSQYRNELPRYFRRYAIRNVFRAEKPQRGRFREFTQCDIDVFGSASPLADAEIVACTYFAFERVGFTDFTIQVNDRRTLVAAVEPFATGAAGVGAILQSIDKLDKIGHDGVVDELARKGLGDGTGARALAAVEATAPSAELAVVLDAARELGVPDRSLAYVPTLARGLDYYTGPIFEVAAPTLGLGSLAGGGRYDELIERLGGPPTPAVGLAFGFDRVVEGAKALGLVAAARGGSQVLVTVFDDASRSASLAIAAALRRAGIRTEVHPGADKLGKQLKLADQKKIPVVVVVGPDEARAGTATVKHMGTGAQKTVASDGVAREVAALVDR
jgi:histidyl-tRNA synthetase